jgi:hypothetical protein
MVWFDTLRNLWFASKKSDANPSTATTGQQQVNLESMSMTQLWADGVWHFVGPVRLEEFELQNELFHAHASLHTAEGTLSSVVSELSTVHGDLHVAEGKLEDLLHYDSAVLAANTFTLDLVERKNSLWSITIPYDIAQVETATVGVGTVTADPGGNATVTVTSAIVDGSPLAVSVPLLKDDVTNTIATKIRAALQNTAAINTKYNVGGTDALVTLTAMTPADNDTSLNIAIATGTATGVTAVPSSANSTAGGVAAKTIAVANPPGSGEFTIDWVHTADAALTWFTTIQWLSGSALNPAAGKTYRITFYTKDGGTTWLAVPIGPFPA